MFKKYYLLILGVLAIQAMGCKEIYEPNVFPAQSILVVEGLVTNAPGPYYIKLSTAAQFNSGQTNQPLQGAEVVVSDNFDRNFTFSETNPGVYISPNELTGIVGLVYKLRITLPNGEQYESSAQEMNQPYSISSLLAEKTVKTEAVETSFGNIDIIETPGIRAILSVDDNSISNPKVRFQSEIMVQYNREITDKKESISNNPPDPPAIPMWYCWKIFYRAQGNANINLPSSNNEPGDINNSIVAFIPKRVNRYYLLAPDEYLMHLLLRVKLYSLNNDSYKFHHDVYKQISSDGSLFAPIPSQLFSNIRCISNPRKPAIGLFEVSAETVEGFIIKEIFSADTVFFVPTNKFNNPPSPDCLNNIKPPFWAE
jgi:hypothetical protein